jgi:asparagine synthase (glutamine-hydrolysing)
MCGIAGIVSPDAYKYIELMTEVIAHRGPDDEGFFIENNIGFGHRRLSIQDLSENAHQPMQSLDGKYVLTFNGEIYNHWDIREKLKDKYTFKSSSDTETLLYGFQEYGVSLFNMLNGIFAFAVLNRETGELFVVRDQFGVKPLYYFHQDDCLLFSSEIKSMLKYPGFKKEIDLNSIFCYLYFLWSPGEMTPFKNCKKLLPGHYLKIDLSNPYEYNTTQYYEIPFKGIYDDKTENEWIDLLEEKLTKAVQRQLLSDVPVGFFLSGGLDSSLIVALAKKISPESRLKCFTIQTGVDSSREGFEDDLAYAKKVAKILDLDLEIVRSNINIVKDFDKMIYYLDEPQADAAPLNISKICEIARSQGYLVLLGGTAGDDLFSGYRRHQSIYYDQKITAIPFFIRKLFSKASSIMGYRVSFTRRLNKLLLSYQFKERKFRLASLMGWLPSERVKKIFRANVEFDPNTFLVNSLEKIPGEDSSLNQQLYWDLKYFLTDHNLNYTDKMSMMHGVEVRVPFLDIELVNFSSTIPPHLKLKGLTTKYILKKVAERYLPKEVIYRSKTGFGAPVRDWVIDDLGEIIKDRLSKKRVDKRLLFVYDEIENLIHENKIGKIDASYSIWALLAIESWITQFISDLE